MELYFLSKYAEIIIVVICICSGYVIKTSLDFIPNKYIPLIMIVLGIITNILIQKGINGKIILDGMFSGLVSTGLHQVFKNLLKHKESNKDN